MGDIRKCNVCGEEWTDTGDYACPYCGSDETEIIDEDDGTNGQDRESYTDTQDRENYTLDDKCEA